LNSKFETEVTKLSWDGGSFPSEWGIGPPDRGNISIGGCARPV